MSAKTGDAAVKGSHSATSQTLDSAEKTHHIYRGTKFDSVLTSAQSFATQTASLYNSAPMARVYNTVVDSLPAVLKVLDEVAELHPFIAGSLFLLCNELFLHYSKPPAAVFAFRAAIELDLKRRENNEKISFLIDEMKEMMTALCPYVSL